MALKISYKLKHNGVLLRSGHFYTFDYTAYENDPSPMIIFISAIQGINPKTGHQWRLIQGINMNYIPRSDRKNFLEIWNKHFDKTNDVKFTWNVVKSKFPYLKLSIRRFMLKPKYYIRKLKYIEPENLQKEMVKSLHKDFSETLKRRLGSRLKKFFVGSRNKR